MAQQRTNFTISDANLRWLKAQAPGERAMSRLVDNILQKARTLDPVEARMRNQADRLDQIMYRLGWAGMEAQQVVKAEMEKENKR